MNDHADMHALLARLDADAARRAEAHHQATSRSAYHAHLPDLSGREPFPGAGWEAWRIAAAAGWW